MSQPTVAGLTRLGDRLAAYPGVVAVADPTSMTWLGLHVALRRAGCDLSLVGTRHAARLRGAISGKHKTDVIDADVLSMAADVFDLSPLAPPTATQLAPVGPARGAVAALLSFRFPGPPAEPGVRFSPHRALHEGVVVQLVVAVGFHGVGIW